MSKKAKRPTIVLLIIVALGLTTNSCVSKRDEYSPPFKKVDLEYNNLIEENVVNQFHVRIVYPSVAIDEEHKKFISSYIDTFDEKKIIDSLARNSSLDPKIREMNGDFYLAIYGYVISYRLNIVSVAFQVQYWTTTTEKTENWYTFNYYADKKKPIIINDLFDNYLIAQAQLMAFVKDDLTRQTLNLDNAIQLQNNNDDAISNILSNFVFVPHQNSNQHFSGLHIYISTDKWRKALDKSQVSNENYIVNIPYSRIQKYLVRDFRSIFKQGRQISLSMKDISTMRNLYFPDLPDQF